MDTTKAFTKNRYYDDGSKKRTLPPPTAAAAEDDFLILVSLVDDEDEEEDIFKNNNQLITIKLPSRKKQEITVTSSTSSPSSSLSSRPPRGIFFDKLDIALLQTPSVEDIYQRMCQTIEKFKAVYYHDHSNNDKNDTALLSTSSRSRCNKKEHHLSSMLLLFGNYNDGWGFDLERFSIIYAQKFQVPNEKMKEKLWGDWYFDVTRKKWRTSSNNDDNTKDSGGKKKERAVCQFVFSPLQQLCQAAMNRDWLKLEKMTRAIGIEESFTTSLKKKQKHQSCNNNTNNIEGQTLLSEICRQWLPYPLPLYPPLRADASSSSEERPPGGRGGEDDDDRTITTIATEDSTRTDSSAVSERRSQQSNRRGSLLRWFSKKK